MRPICHLHIGMTKTGSTTIQAVAARFFGRVIDYDLPKGATTQHALLDRAFLRPRDVARYGRDGAEIAEALAVFDALMSRSDKPVFLSSENLFAWTEPDDIARIAATLSRYAKRTQVILYVRPPRSYLRSALQQRVKFEAPPASLSEFWPQFEKRVSAWDAVFGKDALSIGVVRSDALFRGDLIADLGRRLGTAPIDRPTLPRSNVSPSLEATAALAAWQTARRVRGWRSANDRQSDLAGFARGLAGFGKTKSWGFDAPTYAPVLENHARDLAWMADRAGCPDLAIEPAPAVTVAGLEGLIKLGLTQTAPLRTWLTPRLVGADLAGAKDLPDLMQRAYVAYAAQGWNRTLSERWSQVQSALRARLTKKLA